jgi:hypothetical protein
LAVVAAIVMGRMVQILTKKTKKVIGKWRRSIGAEKKM